MLDLGFRRRLPAIEIDHFAVLLRRKECILRQMIANSIKVEQILAARQAVVVPDCYRCHRWLHND